MPTPDLKAWSVDDVQRWATTLNFPALEAVMKDNAITGLQLVDHQQDERLAAALQPLAWGERKMVHAEIQKLCVSAPSSSIPSSVPLHPFRTLSPTFLGNSMPSSPSSTVSSPSVPLQPFRALPATVMKSLPPKPSVPTPPPKRQRDSAGDVIGSATSVAVGWSARDVVRWANSLGPELQNFAKALEVASPVAKIDGRMISSQPDAPLVVSILAGLQWGERGFARKAIDGLREVGLAPSDLTLRSSPEKWTIKDVKKWVAGREEKMRFPSFETLLEECHVDGQTLLANPPEILDILAGKLRRRADAFLEDLRRAAIEIGRDPGGPSAPKKLRLKQDIDSASRPVGSPRGALPGAGSVKAGIELSLAHLPARPMRSAASAQEGSNSRGLMRPVGIDQAPLRFALPGAMAPQPLAMPTSPHAQQIPSRGALSTHMPVIGFDAGGTSSPLKSFPPTSAAPPAPKPVLNIPASPPAQPSRINAPMPASGPESSTTPAAPRSLPTVAVIPNSALSGPKPASLPSRP
ncbi:hypothetical protein BDK51DRAFT_25531, partial [Blyttiomyces helicus]